MAIDITTQLLHCETSKEIWDETQSLAGVQTKVENNLPQIIILQHSQRRDEDGLVSHQNEEPCW